MERFETLTEKEKELVKIHLQQFENNCDGKTLNDMINDNYSWINIKDFQNKSNLNKHQIAGVVSSLVEKKVIYIDDENDTLYCFNEFWFKNKFNGDDILLGYI